MTLPDARTLLGAHATPHLIVEPIHAVLAYDGLHSAVTYHLMADRHGHILGRRVSVGVHAHTPRGDVKLTAPRDGSVNLHSDTRHFADPVDQL